MARIVIESPTGDRAVVAPEALDQWTLRGFQAVGEAAESCDGVLTVDEWQAELARRDAQVQAALTPTTTRTTTRKKG